MEKGRSAFKILTGKPTGKIHNVMRFIKSRSLRLGGHVAKMEEGKNDFKILTVKPTGNDL